MNLDIYINYPGTCHEAFTFYEQHLGGKVIATMTHGEAPESRLPPEWAGKVLHARLELGGSVVRGADIPNAESMRTVPVNESAGSLVEGCEPALLLFLGMKINLSWCSCKKCMTRRSNGGAECRQTALHLGRRPRGSSAPGPGLKARPIRQSRP